jgi:pimeloyl-ACP methyl ester carboxylesterase
VLVGDSLGGFTAQAVANAFPAGQLKGLVLGGSSANLQGTDLIPYYARMTLFGALTAVFGEPRLIAALMPRRLHEAGLSAADIDALLSGGIHLAAFGQAVRALRNVDFEGQIASIRQPILFVNGDLDRNMVAHEASFLAMAPAARSHRFANTAHGVSVLRPSEFARLVNNFVAEVCGLSGTVGGGHVKAALSPVVPAVRRSSSASTDTCWH